LSAPHEVKNLIFSEIYALYVQNDLIIKRWIKEKPEYYLLTLVKGTASRN